MKPGVPNNSKRFHQGIYTLVNKDKYAGDPTKLYYRSGLEKRFCYFCDSSHKVLRWASEAFAIPYKDVDDKIHNYYPDYYLEIDEGNDRPPKIVVVEVKSSAEVTMVAPKIPEKATASSYKFYKRQIIMWQKNMMKWNYAKSFCDMKGWEFLIVDEKVINTLLSSLRA